MKTLRTSSYKDINPVKNGVGTRQSGHPRLGQKMTGIPYRVIVLHNH